MFLDIIAGKYSLRYSAGEISLVTLDAFRAFSSISLMVGGFLLAVMMVSLVPTSALGQRCSGSSMGSAVLLFIHLIAVLVVRPSGASRRTTVYILYGAIPGVLQVRD